MRQQFFQNPKISALVMANRLKRLADVNPDFRREAKPLLDSLQQFFRLWPEALEPNSFKNATKPNENAERQKLIDTKTSEEIEALKLVVKELHGGIPKAEPFKLPQSGGLEIAWLNAVAMELDRRYRKLEGYTGRLMTRMTVLEISWDVRCHYNTERFPFCDKDDGKRFLKAKIQCDCASFFQHRNELCVFEAVFDSEYRVFGCPSCGETMSFWPTKWHDDGQKVDPGLLTREALNEGWIRLRQFRELPEEHKMQVTRASCPVLRQATMRLLQLEKDMAERQEARQFAVSDKQMQEWAEKITQAAKAIDPKDERLVWYVLTSNKHWNLRIDRPEQSKKITGVPEADARRIDTFIQAWIKEHSGFTHPHTRRRLVMAANPENSPQERQATMRLLQFPELMPKHMRQQFFQNPKVSALSMVSRLKSLADVNPDFRREAKILLANIQHIDTP
jgi:hypothetical protein